MTRLEWKNGFDSLAELDSEASSMPLAELTKSIAQRTFGYVVCLIPSLPHYLRSISFSLPLRYFLSHLSVLLKPASCRAQWYDSTLPRVISRNARDGQAVDLDELNSQNGQGDNMANLLHASPSFWCKYLP